METEPTAEPSEPIEDQPVPETEPPPAPSFGPGLRPVSIVPEVGREPAAGLTDDEATARWVALTAPWHPALLAKSEALPRVEDEGSASSPESGDLLVVAAGSMGRIDREDRERAEDAGIPIVEASRDRPATIAEMLGHAGTAPGESAGETADLAADFLALGAVTRWLDDLTVAMGHADGVDREALTRETLVGARAWAEGDTSAAKNRLRAAFEVLTQARERFYSVDAYLVDLTLFDPLGRPEELDDALASRTPFTLWAPALAVENAARRDPDRVGAFKTAVDEGWADLIGGPYAEADDPLLPLGSVLWNYRKGAEVYREHLDGRGVETLARRRFGLFPGLPQVAKRFGIRFALHLGLDGGTFPIRPEMKRLWESPDGSTLESLTRPPIAADRPMEGARLPWRLAKAMKDDFTAAIPVVHWAGRVAPWFADLRRALAYSPVLFRASTVNDFFHLTDRPFESFRVDPDEYATPYLDQAVRRGDPRPISRRAEHARLRARLDAIGVAAGLAAALGQEAEGDIPSPTDREAAVELGPADEAGRLLDRAESPWSEALARGVGGSGADGTAGYLVFNPTAVARRAIVLLPGASLDLRPGGSLRAAQYTEDGVRGVVDLAPFGYAWVPKVSPPDAPPAPAGALAIRDRHLVNESMSVSVDPLTGGLRGVHGPDEPTARIGQQLVIVGLLDAAGKPALSRMRESAFEADYGGPALVQATARGTLHHPADDRPLASFVQRYRLWSGRPGLEIAVTLSNLDPGWLASIAGADPWSNYLACRWAWPDPESSLRRTSQLVSNSSTAERPETPDAIEVVSRRRKTTLLFGGLAHHRRIRPRMLDTLLVAGKETARTFELGVALDLEHPWQACLDGLAPALVVPTDAGPPKSGPVGWLIALDNPSVAVLDVTHLDQSEDGRGWGLSIVLLETAGRSTRLKVRTFRDPVSARQVDFQDDLIVDLTVDGDAVLVDLTSHELMKLDVTLG